jgi:uroporphyrin-III C-methyltransferase/precorrin-2 dehydrogenase/sirohydrochlorin ferrochelatase
MSGINPLFPLFANIQNRKVLVVGGGNVAQRKVLALLRCGASVSVGAPDLTPDLQALAHEMRIQYLPGPFQPQWLDDMWLVIAATDNNEINALVAAQATERRCLINVVDDPALSSFQVPSIVDRSPLTIAVSSAGVAPVLARRLRERMESLFDHHLGELAQLAERYKTAIRRAYPDTGARRRYYDWLFDGPVLTALRAGRTDHASLLMQQSLAKPVITDSTVVSLTGAGTGDPSQLTLAGLRALNEADLVLYDNQVTALLLDMARRDADQRCLTPTAQGSMHAAVQKHVLDASRSYRRICCLISPLTLNNTELMTLANVIRYQGMACTVVPGIEPAPRTRAKAMLDPIAAVS